MNEWMETFISQCLTDVPRGKYRARTEKELRDHMETQYQVLTGAGASPPEARSRILDTIGDPERLREEYKAAWRRTLQARTAGVSAHIPALFLGCILMGTLYILTAAFLGSMGFTYDAEAPGWTGRCFPLLAEGPNATIFGALIFLIPFTLGALYLRRCFRNEDRPADGVTLGLLAAWAGEKTAIILISLLAYGPPLNLELLVRIYHGGDTTAPWFTPDYQLLTFAGCLVLGQLFGQKMERRRELA